MDADLNLSDVLHDNWLLHQDDSTEAEGIHNVDVVSVAANETFHTNENEEPREDPDIELLEVVGPTIAHGGPKEASSGSDADPKVIETLSELTPAPVEKRCLISPPYPLEQSIPPGNVSTSSNKPTIAHHHHVYYSNHGLPVSSTYHQPFLSMVRTKKQSALTSALQRPAPMFAPAPMLAYIPGYQVGYGVPHPGLIQQQRSDMNSNELIASSVGSRERLEAIRHSSSQHDGLFGSGETSSSFNAFSSSGCGQTTSSSFSRNQHNPCFELPANVLAGSAEDSEDEQNETTDAPNDGQDGRERPINKTVTNGGDAENSDGSLEGQKEAEKRREDAGSGDGGDAKADEGDDEDEEIVVVDVVKRTRGTAQTKNGTLQRDDEEEGATGVAASASEGGAVETATSSTEQKEAPKSELAALLMQPVRRPVYQEYQPFIVTFSASGTQQAVPQQSPKTMQFYQPPAQQHLARATPPPGFAQPYGMNMRPHEEETRQIMNLDNQQTHSSSPTSSWSSPYTQMTNLNAYQPRGQSLYAPQVPTTMVHQNGPPGVVPTSNPYYQAPPHAPQHHHMQPQAPMMPPGMHGQQQQPYYNTQSPLTGTPPSMNYGTPQMPAPQPANGSTPIFNFSKPRTSNESSSGSNGGHRRKKNDLSSPRYNNNSDEVDASVFPDMSDFPLLDVVQSKAKKDAGRKPCRPHLCEQSRMLISRVCHFQREFIKRLPARHPLANSPFSKPDQWTSAIMGISLATVRKCVDMAVDEEVFTRCTDKNLVNLTPSERAEREELLSKLSTVFEDEKSLGAGTAGLTIAEYSPRRSYSNTLLRQSTDDKSSTSSYAMNGAEFGSSETTLLNLDDHSNSSKDFGTTPTPSNDLMNGGHVFEELGVIGGGNDIEKEMVPKVETPKRGRPRKAPGTATTKSSRRKESNEDSEVAEDKNEHEKKTEDEDETNEETEKKTEEPQQLVLVEREDDAASSEGTNRSETATPEPTATATTTTVSASKKARATRRKKRSNAGIDEDYTAATKKKRGSVVSANAGIAVSTQLDDENEEHKMVTRARSRQP